MADGRVIQDSDDSDGAISDTATSIDPLQDTDVAPENDRDRDRQLFETIDGQNLDLMRGNTGDVTLNFDSFLVSQSHEGQQTTASQQQREELWIGGTDVGPKMADSGILQPEIETSHSAPPFSTISPKKTMLKRGRSTSPLDEARHGDIVADTKQKRRKTVGPSNTTSWDQENHAHEANFDLSVGSNPTVDQNGPSSDTFQIGRRFSHSGMGNETSTVPTDDPTFEDGEPTTMEIARAGTKMGADSQDQSREKLLSRSRSAPMDPSSPHDTEPMSSLSFARARRANTEIDGIMPHSSFDTRPKNPALKESVQVVIADRDSRSYETRSSRDYRSQSDRDELDSEDFGGMPREYYKPRPSRSRSKPTHLVHVDQDHHQGQDPGLAIVIPQETPSVQPHWKSEERIGDTETEFTKDKQHESNGPVEGCEDGTTFDSTPLDAAASSPRGSEISAIEPPVPTRKAAKKKLKREKTTSASFTEVVDSEDEDDVVFLEEKPVAESVNHPPKPFVQMEQTGEMSQGVNKPSPTPVQSVPEYIHAEEADEKHNFATASSASKKRSRKRKKTVEATSAEPTPVPADLPEPLEDNTPLTTDITEAHRPVVGQATNTTPQPPPENSTKSTGQATEGHEENKDQDLNDPSQTAIPASTPQDKIPDPHPQEGSPKAPKTPAKPEKGPDKHSPISITNKASFRVGLSRKARIAPLLKVVKK